MAGEIIVIRQPPVTFIGGGGSGGGGGELNVFSPAVAADGSTDDSVPLQNTANQAGDVNGIVQLPRGKIAIKVRVQIPSGVKIRGTLGTVIRGMIPTPFGFDSNPLTRNPNQIASGTVAADAPRGATEVHVTGFVPVVGGTLGVGHQDSNAVFAIEQVSGSGPYIVTIDEPLPWPLVTDDLAGLELELPNRYGVEDVTMTGTGASHAILFTNSRRCYLRRIRMTTEHGNSVNAGLGFDACSEGTIEECEIDRSGGVTSPAIYMQTAVRSIIRKCRTRGGAYGIYLSDAYQSGIEDCWAYGSDVGIAFFTLFAEGQNYGNRGCWIRGGGAIGCGSGLDIIGSVDCTVSDFTAEACAGEGLTINVYAGLPTRGLRFVNCNTIACPIGAYLLSGVEDTTFYSHSARECTYGIRIASGVERVSFHGLDISDCTTRGFWNAANTRIVVRDLMARGYTGSALPIVNEAGDLEVLGGYIEFGSAGAVAILHAGNSIKVRNVLFALTNGSQIAVQAGGDAEIEGCTVHMGQGVGLQFTGSRNRVVNTVVTATDSAAYPYQCSAGAGVIEDCSFGGSGKCMITSAGTQLFVRRGTFVAAGGGAVDLSSDRAVIDGSMFDFTGAPTASSCILVRAGVLTLRDVIATGPADTVAVEVVTGATVRFEGRTRLSGFGLNVLVNSGAYVNFGVLTANGATGVDAAFPDLQEDDRVTIERKTTGGTPAPFRVTLNPGTGFTFTGTSGDSSDYYWKIV